LEGVVSKGGEVTSEAGNRSWLIRSSCGILVPVRARRQAGMLKATAAPRFHRLSASQVGTLHLGVLSLWRGPALSRLIERNIPKGCLWSVLREVDTFRHGPTLLLSESGTYHHEHASCSHLDSYVPPRTTAEPRKPATPHFIELRNSHSDDHSLLVPTSFPPRSFKLRVLVVFTQVDRVLLLRCRLPGRGAHDDTSGKRKRRINLRRWNGSAWPRFEHCELQETHKTGERWWLCK